jgi:hypothetical protein
VEGDVSMFSEKWEFNVGANMDMIKMMAKNSVKYLKDLILILPTCLPASFKDMKVPSLFLILRRKSSRIGNITQDKQASIKTARKGSRIRIY